jgi:tetratricopeptide (TPR) repeat protein
MRIHIFTLALVPLLLVGTACPKGGGGPPPIDELMAPEDAFRAGVRLLQTPDKKGEVDYAGAHRAFTIAADQAPNHPRVRFNAGWSSERVGDVQSAERHYKAALQAEPTYKAALFNLGALLADNGKADEAAEYYRDYLEGSPNDVAIRNNLVEAYLQAGIFEAAVEEVQRILMIDPENVAAYRNLSRVYFAKGEPSMALLAGEKAKLLNESDPGIHNNIGLIQLEQGNESAAIEAFRNAITLDPNNLEARLNLGWVALRSGDFKLARENFAAVGKKYPENVDARMGLAIALRGSGKDNYDEAAKNYDKILAIDKCNGLALRNASTLHEMYLNDFKKAKGYLTTWQECLVGTAGYGLEHPVHQLVRRVEASEGEYEAEKDRQAAEVRRMEDLRKQQLEALKSMEVALVSFEKNVNAVRCAAVEEMGMLEDFDMIIETGKEAVESEEFSLVPQLNSFMGDLESMLPDLAEVCAMAGPEEAPAPDEGSEGEAVEEEGAEEAPTEEAAGSEETAEGGE